MDIANRILPVTSAYAGKSCTFCCDSPKKLLRCASCKLSCYCSKGCQRADWPKHKIECKLLSLLKELYPDIPVPDNRQAKALGFLTTLPLFLNRADAPKGLPKPSELAALSKERFSKFVMYCRACSICLRHEFSSNCGDPEAKIDWQCCPDCNFGWCCSSKHWEEYKSQHTPEICSTYQRSANIELFHYQHAKKNNEILVQMPEQVLTSALETFPKNWDSYFRTRFVGLYPQLLPQLPPEFFPATTKLLCQPVTCLAAMYKFGLSHFSTTKNLTIHVVGADSYEVPATCVWEEITHCLPNVKSLTVQFVGPDACKCIIPATRDFPTEPVLSCCPECTKQGRNRLTGMFGYTYHEYLEKYLATSKHSKPDFIVAFNTGMFENDTESWKTSLEVILDMNVPSYFTSYCKQEAVEDFALLQNMKANILQETPEENAFGEDCMSIQAASQFGIDNFFANNMYGVLFQGRSKNA
jgi:mitochondrial splicing suppressor protein 51